MAEAPLAARQAFPVGNPTSPLRARMLSESDVPGGDILGVSAAQKRDSTSSPAVVMVSYGYVTASYNSFCSSAKEDVSRCW